MQAFERKHLAAGPVLQLAVGPGGPFTLASVRNALMTGERVCPARQRSVGTGAPVGRQTGLPTLTL